MRNSIEEAPSIMRWAEGRKVAAAQIVEKEARCS